MYWGGPECVIHCLSWWRQFRILWGYWASRESKPCSLVTQALICRKGFHLPRIWNAFHTKLYRTEAISGLDELKGVCSVKFNDIFVLLPSKVFRHPVMVGFKSHSYVQRLHLAKFGSSQSGRLTADPLTSPMCFLSLGGELRFTTGCRFQSRWVCF